MTASVLKRVGLEGLGWVLLLGGAAALFLPGPGLLLIVAGLALLSQQYDWAKRRLDPLKNKALETAADGVESWPKIALSALGVLALIGLGLLWCVKPDVPGWWPLSDAWWLPGGWGTGTSLIVSALIALATIVYSYRNLRDIKAHDRTP